MKGSPRLEYHPPPGMGTLLTGAPAPQCCHHVVEGEGEDQPKMPLSSTKWACQSTGPCTPLCKEYTDREILDLAEQVNWGEYILAPSELPCQQQEECMMELRQELCQHMTRVGLRKGLATTTPPFCSWRHSCGHWSLWTWSLQLDHMGLKQPTDHERTHQQGHPDPRADISNPNAGTRHNDVRAPHPQSHALRHPLTDPSDHSSPSPSPLLALIPWMSGSTAPWVTSISTPNSENLEVRCGGSTSMHAQRMPSLSAHTVAECPPLASV